ncbi:MAG: hypothetical protein WCP85_07420 [Mariniphaga sp.]
MNYPDFLFLIGGKDLEMEAILHLLADNQLQVADHHLTWGAKLSSYQSLFNDYQTFVGIELIPDIELPNHYIEIDHHNKNSYKRSSLEQIIELLEKNLRLKIDFTRDLQLIAANDKGYVPAMFTMGAKLQEVADIRRRDRKAQGVTPEDELLAEQSIRENLTIEGGITIVKSLTHHFSAVTDRLYPCDKLLVSHQNYFIYYGKGANLLSQKYNHLIAEKKAFYGGENTGFFGIAKEYFTINEIEVLIDEIINLIQNS